MHLVTHVGQEGRQEALDFLRIARLSWRLRDDDNILMGRLEGQLLRAAELGRERMRQVELRDAQDELAKRLAAVLETLENRVSSLRSPVLNSEDLEVAAGESARQLVGQPAAPGLGEGVARCVRNLEDLVPGSLKGGVRDDETALGRLSRLMADRLGAQGHEEIDRFIRGQNFTRADPNDKGVPASADTGEIVLGDHEAVAASDQAFDQELANGDQALAGLAPDHDGQSLFDHDSDPV